MEDASFLDTFCEYSVEEFVEFLQNNGLSEFETVAIRKNLDGRTFLNLAEFEIKSWKPLLSAYQVHKFWSFLNQLRESPEDFVFVAAPTVPANPPTVNRNQLQKLAQNDSFLNSLRKAVSDRAGNKKKQPEQKKPPPTTNSADKRNQQDPLPPKPPARKKPPLLPPPKFHDSESEDPEIIYESPDDEERDFNKKKFEKVPAKRLPDLPLPSPPPVFVAASNPVPTGKVLKETEAKQTQSKPVKKQPFKLGLHYNRQRELEREQAKLAVQNAPVRKSPSPLKEVAPKKLEKLPSIPRPPKTLPRVEVAELSDSPDGTDSDRIDQESYYRYTDRKGAEELLSEEYSDGTFLLRPSRAYYGTLSVRKEDKVYHLGIKKIDGGILEMDAPGLDLKFKNLDEIIIYFRNNPLTVRNKYNQIVDIYLTKTLPPDRT